MVLAATDCYLAGRYRLCRWLAAGGMGQVWRAVDEVLGRPVAVKLLRDEYAQDPSFVRRLRAEARYAAAVTHPGVASIFDYGEVTTYGAQPTAFLVMELIDGEPLSALLAREGRLELDRSLDIVGQAALAVGAAHRVGLVHRDIKPANLLVCPDGTVKVTDFGVAQALGQGQGDHDELMCGTAGYLSPEQATGQPATAASDLYALGVVAYECLAGRRPFTGEHPIAVALGHLLQRPPPLPDDVPAQVRVLVAQAMAKQPTCRPPDASVFGHHLLSLGEALATSELDADGSSWRRLQQQRPADRSSVTATFGHSWDGLTTAAGRLPSGGPSCFCLLRQAATRRDPRQRTPSRPQPGATSCPGW
jgi:eukaryotic-like serine/threonine-protein kinase